MGPLNLHALDASLETLGTKGGETVLMRALEALQGERYLRLAEAQSSDPWTSRARPSFLYMVYALIVWTIPMGLIAAADPRNAKGIADGMTAFLRGFPRSSTPSSAPATSATRRPAPGLRSREWSAKARGREMRPERLNALTDGVVAIVLTIMVLELKFPEEPTLAAVLAVLPLLAAYLLAFIYVAIYWNNHHHMMQSAHKVTGGVLWANHSLLFWLTLFPLMIRWIDEAGMAHLPVASFGLVLIGASISYLVLERTLIAADGEDSGVKKAVGRGTKEWVSFALYVAAVVIAFVSPPIAVAIYVAVAAIWLIPDRRFVRA